MTSISSSQSWQVYSPSQALLQQLQTDTSSGAISSTDATALTNAIDNIGSSLSPTSASSTTASTASASTQPPSPDDMQSKISSLVDAQVSNGTLTASQGSELKDLFSQTFGANNTSGSGQVHGHHGGHHHGGAPVASTDTDQDSDGTTSIMDTSSTTASDSSSATNLQDLVSQFLQNVQNAQSTSYSAAGTNAASNTSSYLLNVVA